MTTCLVRNNRDMRLHATKCLYQPPLSPLLRPLSGQALAKGGGRIRRHGGRRYPETGSRPSTRSWTRGSGCFVLLIGLALAACRPSKPEMARRIEQAGDWALPEIDLATLKLAEVFVNHSVVLTDGARQFAMVKPGQFAGREKAKLASVGPNHAVFKYDEGDQERTTVLTLKTDANGARSTEILQLSPGPRENPLKDFEARHGAGRNVAIPLPDGARGKTE